MALDGGSRAALIAQTPELGVLWQQEVRREGEGIDGEGGDAAVYEAVMALDGGSREVLIAQSPKLSVLLLEALENGFTCALELTVTKKLELLVQGGRRLLRQALFSRLPQTLAACTAVVRSIGSKEAAAVERLGLEGLGTWLVCEEPVLVVSALISSPVGIHEELKFLLNRGLREASKPYTSRLGRNLELFTCLGIGADLECKTKNHGPRTRRRTQRPTRRRPRRERGGEMYHQYHHHHQRYEVIGARLA
jgi:hypothetical protein